MCRDSCIQVRGAGGKVSCHVQRQLHSGQLERERGGGEGELPCAETVAFRSVRDA